MPPDNDSAARRPADHVAWECLSDDSLVLCHLPSGVMLELSAPAGALWTLLVAGATPTSLARVLQHDFGSTPDQAITGARALLDDFAHRDLLAAAE